jgi:hypothetical protein
MVLKFIIVSVWICLLVILTAFILFRKILPKYKITVSDVSFQELLLALNAEINTELELWRNDVFVNDNGIANNSQYENYYHEISTKIVHSLSPIYYENIEKYITTEAVVSIVGRKVKTFLNEYVKEPFPEPSVKMLFDEEPRENNEK